MEQPPRKTSPATAGASDATTSARAYPGFPAAGQDHESLDVRYSESLTRAALLDQLMAIGHPSTTVVVVNGVPVPLRKAIKLVQLVPEPARFSRHDLFVTIEPDPFSAVPSDIGS